MNMFSKFTFFIIDYGGVTDDWAYNSYVMREFHKNAS